MGENLAWSEGRELFCSEGLRERIAVSASCPQPVQRVRLESCLSEGHLHVVRLSDRRFQRNFESSYRLPGMALRSIVSAEPVGIDRLEKERIDGAPAQADEHIRGAVFGALDTYFADDRRAAGGERKADGPYRDHECRPQDTGFGHVRNRREHLHPARCRLHAPSLPARQRILVDTASWQIPYFWHSPPLGCILGVWDAQTSISTTISWVR